MLEIKKSDCCGCAACASICPKKCIKMRPDSEGFLYPNIDVEECVKCGKCEKACPALNNQSETVEVTPSVYAGYVKDETVRLKSSSGGIFTELAKNVLDKGGVVFGAALSEDCKTLRHVEVDQEERLEILRGSKYFQSNISDAYVKIKKYLETGTEVLFSGTPCEIEGLKKYLQKDYDKLLCVDLICHGVPSANVWEKYLQYQEGRAGAPVQHAFFRHKENGWKLYSLLLTFSNDRLYKQIFKKDLFMQMFLDNLCLRPSCYECKFKKMNRQSDITLGDFWGCQDLCPEMDDDKGTSLIVVHSEKGKAIFNEIQKDIVSREVSFQAVEVGNPAYLVPSPKPLSRGDFMSHLNDWSIPKLCRKYLQKPTLKQKVKNMIPKNIKNYLKRIKHSEKWRLT